MMEWQPIETAPRDGSWFLIWIGDRFEVGQYDPLIRDSYELVCDGLYKRKSDIIFEWHGFSNFHLATHWMPLPSPPRETGHE